MEQSKFDLLTGRENSLLGNVDGHQLQKEVITAFKGMQKKALADGVNIKIVSSFRNFERQQIIWDAKVSGERKVLDDHGELVDLAKLSELKKVEAIMRFSALPGSSRHHWGTEIDVFDGNIKEKRDVQLTPQESIEDFRLLNEWLDENMNDFGFYRPYANDLGGVSPELWHLSYAMISQDYYLEYNIECFKKNIEISNIALKAVIKDNLEYLFEKFVLNVEKPLGA